MSVSESTTMETERDKRAKFLELANKRVNRAIKDLGLIANLANRKNYDYTEEEAKKVIRALQAEVDHVKHNFTIGIQSSKNQFKI
jgi:hypothetical protein